MASTGDSTNEVDDAELEKSIGGEYNTFRVYIHMLKVKVAGVRDVQRAMDLSSPTLAQHHLEKLRKFGLVVRDDAGSYHVKSRSFGILKLYVRGGRWIIPRTLFFVIIFTVLSAGFLTSTPQHSFFWLAFAISIAGLVFALYETVRFYRVLPRV